MAGIARRLTDPKIMLQWKEVEKMYKLALLLFLFGCNCLAQSKTYGMQLSPATPPFQQDGNTVGPLTVGGELQGLCTSISYPRGYKFPPQVNQYTIDTGNNRITIGIILPDGTPTSCHEMVSYDAHGSVVEYKNAISVNVPGVSAGVFCLEWIFNGKTYNYQDWETDYCVGTDKFVDNISLAPC